MLVRTRLADEGLDGLAKDGHDGSALTSDGFRRLYVVLRFTLRTLYSQARV